MAWLDDLDGWRVALRLVRGRVGLRLLRRVGLLLGWGWVRLRRVRLVGVGGACATSQAAHALVRRGGHADFTG